MGDVDLPSDSDSSDEDFIPEGAENDNASEVESDNDQSGPDAESSEDENQVDEKKKRKKTGTKKKSRKKLKSLEKEEKDRTPIETEEELVKKTEISAEDRKQKADALWADFMKDCGEPVKRKSEIPTNNAVISDQVNKSVEKPEPVKVVEEFEFAGEKVLVEKKVTPSTNGSMTSGSRPMSTSLPARGRGRGGRSSGGGRPSGGGIGSILDRIGKKNKLSTLEKSKLDWDSFKKDEGIEEELEHHNKGKNGYLERQDFLERADLKQFEIEKTLRATKRTSLR